MKKILLIFLLLLPLNVVADDLLDSLRDYQVGLRKAFCVDTASQSFISDAYADFWIRLSIASIVPATKADKAVIYDTTVFRQKTYALDTTIAGISGVQWVKYDTIKPLRYMSMENWQRGYGDLVRSLGDESGALERRPYFYDYSDSNLFLYPAPITGGDSLQIVCWRKTRSLMTDSSFASIPRMYRAAVLHYAAWMIARSKQNPLLEHFRQSYIESIQLAKEALGESKTTTAVDPAAP